MSSLSLQELRLGASLMKAVKQRAKDEGKTAPQYIRSLIERDIRSAKSFDQILKPFREDIRKAGVSSEALDQIVEKARSDSRIKRRGARR